MVATPPSDPAFITALTAALSAITKHLARDLAPIRVNLIAAGFIDTPLSMAALGDQLEARREQLGSSLPIGRTINPPTSRRLPCTS